MNEGPPFQAPEIKGLFNCFLGGKSLTTDHIDAAMREMSPVERDTIGHLDLSNNCLTSVPEGILRLSYLTGLNLRRNPIETIPPWIGDRMTQLTFLGLSKTLPSTLPGSLVNLTKLEK